MSSDSNAENVRFMSFKCPDTAALCKQTGRTAESQPSTYVVILNQESEKQCAKTVPPLDQQIQGTKHTGLVWKNKAKSRISLSTNDDLRLNLTNGYDEYDSFSTSQKVFQDESEGTKSGKFGETTKVIRLKIPSSLQKAMQISQKFNAHRMLAETPTSQLSKVKGEGKSVHQPSHLTESGYSSANSSCFSRESFETPSPVPMHSQHQTARQIFQKLSMDLSKETPVHTSPSLPTPSPISSLSSGLCNAALFQSSPSFSGNQRKASDLLNLHRTSTPRSGYVVESADGHKFILPVDPHQTKTVSVSKSDSQINIKPLDMNQFMNNSNSNSKPNSKCSLEDSNFKPETQTHSGKNNQVCGRESIRRSLAQVTPLGESVNYKSSHPQQVEYQSSSLFSKEKVGDVVIKCSLQNKENVVKVEMEEQDSQSDPPDFQEPMDTISHSQESTGKGNVYIGNHLDSLFHDHVMCEVPNHELGTFVWSMYFC